MISVLSKSVWPADIVMFSFINFLFLFIRKKDGLTDGLLNNLVRYTKCYLLQIKEGSSEVTY